MFDRLATRLIRPAVDALAAPLAHAGVQANTVTILALALGLGAASLRWVVCSVFCRAPATPWTEP